MAAHTCPEFPNAPANNLLAIFLVSVPVAAWAWAAAAAWLKKNYFFYIKKVKRSLKKKRILNNGVKRSF